MRVTDSVYIFCFISLILFVVVIDDDDDCGDDSYSVGDILTDAMFLLLIF